MSSRAQIQSCDKYKGLESLNMQLVEWAVMSQEMNVVSIVRKNDNKKT